MFIVSVSTGSRSLSRGSISYLMSNMEKYFLSSARLE